MSSDNFDYRKFLLLYEQGYGLQQIAMLMGMTLGMCRKSAIRAGWKPVAKYDRTDPDLKVDIAIEMIKDGASFHEARVASGANIARLTRRLHESGISR